MPAEVTPLDFDELQAELHQVRGQSDRRCGALDPGDLIAQTEGEFAGVHSAADDADDVWFEVAGKEPPERKGIVFIVAFWGP